MCVHLSGLLLKIHLLLDSECWEPVLSCFPSKVSHKVNPNQDYSRQGTGHLHHMKAHTVTRHEFLVVGEVAVVSVSVRGTLGDKSVTWTSWTPKGCKVAFPGLNALPLHKTTQLKHSIPSTLFLFSLISNSSNTFTNKSVYT